MMKGYDAIGAYHDDADPRLVVPKRDPRFGWTLNMAHAAAGPLLMGIGVLIGAAAMAAALH